jgi:TfoX/Sxy family transcriptional regulator of competence genes
VPARKGKRKPASAEIDPSFRPVVDAFADHRDITSGKLMSSYALKVNGKIFAMFERKQFVAKPPKSQVDALVSAGARKRFDPGHGRLMKEWLVAADGGPDWLELAKEAYNFVKRRAS